SRLQLLQEDHVRRQRHATATAFEDNGELVSTDRIDSGVGHQVAFGKGPLAAGYYAAQRRREDADNARQQRVVRLAFSGNRHELPFLQVGCLDRRQVGDADVGGQREAGAVLERELTVRQALDHAVGPGRATTTRSARQGPGGKLSQRRRDSRWRCRRGGGGGLRGGGRARLGGCRLMVRATACDGGERKRGGCKQCYELHGCLLSLGLV